MVSYPKNFKKAPFLGMPKGLLTFASPENFQNFEFFMYTKKGSDLRNFGQIRKIEMLFQKKVEPNVASANRKVKSLRKVCLANHHSSWKNLV